MLTLACGGDDTGGSTSTATSNANAGSATPTATAAAAKEFASVHFGVPVSMTADATWRLDYDVGGWYAIKHEGTATDPSGYLEMLRPTAVHAYDGLSTGPVPADLVAWLEANPSLVEQSKSDVTVGGLTGKRLDIGSNTGSSFPLFDVSVDSFEVNYSDRIRFYVLDGPSGQIVLAAHAEPASVFDRLMPLVEPVVESIRFTQQ
jgi:hypothetical protein